MLRSIDKAIINYFDNIGFFLQTGMRIHRLDILIASKAFVIVSTLAAIYFSNMLMVLFFITPYYISEMYFLRLHYNKSYKTKDERINTFVILSRDSTATYWLRIWLFLLIIVYAVGLLAPMEHILLPKIIALIVIFAMIQMYGYIGMMLQYPLPPKKEKKVHYNTVPSGA